MVATVLKWLSARGLLACLLCGAMGLAGCGKNQSPSVVIYTSQDEVFAEPILAEFTKETGIAVRPVYDSEAVKTVGLVNRLLTERVHPQCDVFWNNEEFRTRQLAARGLFRQTNGWTRLGFRTRRLVINTNFLTAAAAPRAFSDATNQLWRGKVALAYPLFGTTATHFHALRQLWGDGPWRNWCRALAANKPFLVDGNSVVVQMVARGEAWVGFTDSDDIAGAQREGLPVAPLPVTDQTLFVFNTVGVIRDCPHPDAAERLYEFLSNPKVSEKLVELRALEAAALPPAQAASGIKVDWDQLLQDLDTVTAETKDIFLR
ncbi:MAG: extracellular solute-binding protein [Verrucomicrobiota bacterium]|jgi:iron(III) transport system substrate-binding protein